MNLQHTYELDRESSTPFAKIEEVLRKEYFTDLNLQYPAEVVKYEFGIDPYTDEKGKEHPFEPPRPCIRWGLHRTCAMMSAGQLKADMSEGISKAIAQNMLKESKEWFVLNWPDKKTEFSKVLPKFQISPVTASGTMATDPKRQRELTEEAINRAVTQFKPQKEEKR